MDQSVNNLPLPVVINRVHHACMTEGMLGPNAYNHNNLHVILVR